MAAVDSGTGAYAAASIFRVSVSYIYKVLGRRKRTGETSARPWAGGPKPKLAAHDEALCARLMSEPDMTLAELQADRGARAQGRHRLPLEKPAAARIDAQKKSLRAAEQDRAEIAEARGAWRASQPDLNPEHLVFIDETWAKTNMVRLYGRAPRGQRRVAPVPHGHWMTTTFVAALRHDEIAAPCVFDGPMDGASFLTYVEHFLAPTLRPSDIVLMDNLASHTVAGVKEAIERAGATLCCQPIAPTSIPSNKFSQSSKQLFGKPPPEHLTPSSRR
jgi:DDE superfamily endonuclease